jgi:hypothetical protein
VNHLSGADCFARMLEAHRRNIMDTITSRTSSCLSSTHSNAFERPGNDARATRPIHHRRDCRKLFRVLDKGKHMLRIIMFFVALALVIYLFERPIVPESIDPDPSALALADKIEKCDRIYGNENNRKKDFANCQANCSKNTDDKIRVCIDSCQATANQFSNCANQAVLPK